MGILKEIFKKVKDEKTLKEEGKFNKLSDAQKNEVVNGLLRLDDYQLQKKISAHPYLMPYLMAKKDMSHIYPVGLVDIALEKGVSIYDLLDKSTTVSNDTIINHAIIGHPEIVFEIEDKKQYADHIWDWALEKAFIKNPQIMFSSLKKLDEPIELTRYEYVDGERKIFIRKSTLRKVFQRALNLYFRPEAYSEKQFDDWSKEIAGLINVDNFVEKVQDNKMITRVTTAANETLKRNPEKGSVIPGSALHMNNNKVMYVIPNQARKALKHSNNNYDAYWKYMTGLLMNPALNTASNAEKTRLVKRCVSIIPEIYFGLHKVAGYENVLNQLTVRVTAYETFRKQNKDFEADALLQHISEEDQKKVLARAKANVTRKKNKAQKAKEEKELALKKD